MDRFSIAAAVATVAFAALPLAALAQTPPPAPGWFTSLVEGFVHDLHRFDPVEADREGSYDFADALPDLSAHGEAQKLAALRSWRARFLARATPNDPIGLVADRRAVLDVIDQSILESQLLDPLHTDPAVYIGTIGDAVYLPLIRQNESADARFGHIAKRLSGIPAVVDAAIANLGRATAPAAELASRQLPGTIELYEKLPESMNGVSPAVRARVTAGIPGAVTALRRLQTFIDGPLRARSDRSPRIGASAYAQLFKVDIGTDVTPAELASRARERIAATRAAMLAIAEPIYATLPTKAPLPPAGEARTTAIVRAVLDRTADHHAAPGEYLATIRSDVTKIRAFLQSSHFVDLPQPDTLQVRETPPFMAGVAGASMSTAGPYAPHEPSYYNVDPFPSNWDAAKIDSWLREYNDTVTQILTIHESLPGHYVQLRYANENPSLVRRVLGNGSFIEGYACWTEGAMLDIGYGNNDPELRLSQLKWRLREATNALIDIEFHTGSLSEAEATRMMVDDAFQERSEAAGKWHRLALSHVQLATYYAGLDAIERAQHGAGLDNRAMIRKLLAMGSVEPRFIAPLLAAH